MRVILQMADQTIVADAAINSGAPRFTHAFTAGDRLPTLTGTDEGVDLTGYTVTLALERPTTLLSKTATLPAPTQGQFAFAWAAGDIVTGLGQRGTVRATNGAGLTETIARFLLDVVAAPT